MPHILLAGLDQLGQFVVALLEEHVDIRPGFCGIMLQTDQTVINDDGVKAQDEKQSEQDKTAHRHDVLLGVEVKVAAQSIDARRRWPADSTVRDSRQ
jgi:hypothetical protein